MAVVSVEELPQNRGGRSGAALDQVMKRVFLVKTDDLEDNYFTIIGNATLLSATGTYLSAHPDNSFFTRRVLSIESSSPLHWIVTAPYSTAPISREERLRQQYPNPTLRPTRFAGDSEDTERYATQDRDGNPLQNSAEDAYPPIAVPDNRAVLLVSKDVTTFSSSLRLLNNTLNEQAYEVTDGVRTETIPVECGFLKRLRFSELKEENGLQFYTISGEIHVKENPEDWYEHLLDEGFQRLVDGEPERIYFLDDEGNRVYPATSQLLDKAGGVLAKGETPQFNEFKLLKKARWTDLPWGTEV